MRSFCRLSLALTLLGAPVASADTVVLAPLKDNTLYEDGTGSLSNGAGSHFFAGQTGQLRIVRGLLEFDVVGSLPPGATINGVTLTLFMSRTNNPNVETVSLHRALAEWGEGASIAPMGEGGGGTAQPGDATWLHTSFATSFWASAGGDFDPGPSASTGVGGVGPYAWTSAQLAADVAAFLASPADNHGWAVIGNEAALAKRFDSRTNPVSSQQPQLTIDFSAPPAAVPALGTGGTLLLGALLLGAAFAGLRRGRAGASGAASGLSRPA